MLWLWGFWGPHDFSFFRIPSLGLRPLQDHLHRLVVVSLDFEVGDPAVPLGRGNLTMAQEVLNSSQVRIGVEKLSGHGVAEAMAGDVQPAFSCIGFHPLLDASHG